MKIYRVAKKQFVNNLSGEGARLYGGRWNREGEAVLYFCEHLSLCVLELLARIDYEFLTKDYYFIQAEVSTRYLSNFANPETISQHWRKNPHVAATQDYGSKWLQSNNGLGLMVPSAILPSENNLIINPNHSAFSNLKILKSAPLNLDDRISV